MQDWEAEYRLDLGVPVEVNGAKYTVQSTYNLDIAGIYYHDRGYYAVRRENGDWHAISYSQIDDIDCERADALSKALASYLALEERLGKL